MSLSVSSSEPSKPALQVESTSDHRSRCAVGSAETDVDAVDDDTVDRHERVVDDVGRLVRLDDAAVGSVRLQRGRRIGIGLQRVDIADDFELSLDGPARQDSDGSRYAERGHVVEFVVHVRHAHDRRPILPVRPASRRLLRAAHARIEHEQCIGGGRYVERTLRAEGPQSSGSSSQILSDLQTLTFDVSSSSGTTSSALTTDVQSLLSDLQSTASFGSMPPPPPPPISTGTMGTNTADSTTTSASDSASTASSRLAADLQTLGSDLSSSTSTTSGGSNLSTDLQAFLNDLQSTGSQQTAT